MPSFPFKKKKMSFATNTFDIFDNIFKVTDYKKIINSGGFFFFADGTLVMMTHAVVCFR